VQQKDYYKILEVEENATEQQIKEAYHGLALQYHPDRNKDNPSATEKMKEINEAYSVLSNSQKRRQYDALRHQYGSFGYERFRQNYTEEDIFKGSDINSIFDELAKVFGFRSADEIFRDMYGSKYQSFEFRAPGVFGRGFIFFGPYMGRSGLWQKSEEIYSSRKPPIFSEQVPFLSRLFGRIIKYALMKLTGIEIPERGKDLYDVIHLTPEQAQTGDEIRYPYRKGGKPRDLMVKIPPGIRDGQQIRLKGLGASTRNGGVAGDLYLRVKIQNSLYGKVKNFLNTLGFLGFQGR
jgi:DnaJ-class molecular chaperone